MYWASLTGAKLGQSISKTAALVGCSWSAVVSIYQKWSKEERNSGEPVTGSWASKAHWCTGGVKAGPCGPVSEYTVHRRLLGMGLHSCIAADQSGCPCWPVHRQKRQQWAREHQNWTTEQWKKVAWSNESCFLLHLVDGRVCVHCLPGEHMAPGCTKCKLAETVWCFGQTSAGKSWVLPSMWMLLWHVHIENTLMRLFKLEISWYSQLVYHSVF